MEDGGWRMENGGWKMEDGGWMMKDGGWGDGGWRVGGRRVSDGRAQFCFSLISSMQLMEDERRLHLSRLGASAAKNFWQGEVGRCEV